MKKAVLDSTEHAERIELVCPTDEHSVNGLLLNPFAGKSRDELEDMVDDFLKKTLIDTSFTNLFRKGVLLAQDSHAFDNGRVDGMTLRQEEKQALAKEGPGGKKWSQPGILYALVACCSMGAAVQGWDETAVNQAQVYYQSPLQVDSGDPRHPSFKLGLLNCAPYLCCALVGCWLTDPLNRYLGRRGTIFVSCLISSITCFWQGLTNTWWHMFLARLALGLGIGPKSATVPVYASECTPKQIRGSLVMMWQAWTAFGIMLGYISGVAFQNVEPNMRWRLIIASPAILPLVVCGYVFTLPESPRWLLAKARRSKKSAYYYGKSFDSLCRLRNSPLQAARDMITIYYAVENEMNIRKQHNRFIEMFSIPRNRRGLQASSLVMFLQQFCGVNVLAYYSSLIFLSAGFSQTAAPKASMGFGIINFVFALPAFYTIDTFGRRNLLLLTFPLMSIFQLMTGLGFIAPEGSIGRKAIVTLGMYLFAAAYSPGEGPVPFLYSSESMPLYVRDLGMSLFTAVTWLFNFVLSITFPPFLNAFGLTGTFGYYAAWCFIGFIAILLFVPETADQTLEELDARFSVPTRTHAAYGIRQLRWVISHFILRRKTPMPVLDMNPVLPPSSATGTSSGHDRLILGPGGSAAQMIERKFPVEETMYRNDSVVSAYGYEGV